MTSQPKLILFAFDVLDYTFCEKFMKNGKMPNLNKYVQRNDFKFINDEYSITELGLYNTIFTGEDREEVGYYAFRQLKPGTYDIMNDVEGEDFGNDPFWGNINKKVCVLDVFDARVIPNLDGIQVQNWSVNNMKRKTIVEPSTILKNFPELNKPLLVNQKFPSTKEESVEIYHNLMARIETKLETYTKIIQSDDFELIVIGFGEFHCAGHQFYDEYILEDYEIKSDIDRILHQAMENIYSKSDEVIGKILSLFSDNVNVMFISQSSFKPLYPFEDFNNRFLKKLNLTVETKPSLTSYLNPITYYRKLIPIDIRLKISDKLLSKNQQDKIFINQFEKGINWNQTKAFDLFSMFHTLIRINLINREPQGQVSENEYDEIVDDLILKMSKFRDKKSNQLIYEKIIKVKGTFTEEIPYKLPDIMARFNDFSYFVEEVILHDGTVIKQDKNLFFRSSEHAELGFFAYSGSYFEGKKTKNDVKFIDFTPTFYDMFGIKPDLELKGEKIFS